MSARQWEPNHVVEVPLQLKKDAAVPSVAQGPIIPCGHSWLGPQLLLHPTLGCGNEMPLLGDCGWQRFTFQDEPDDDGKNRAGATSRRGGGRDYRRTPRRASSGG